MYLARYVRDSNNELADAIITMPIGREGQEQVRGGADIEHLTRVQRNLENKFAVNLDNLLSHAEQGDADGVVLVEKVRSANQGCGHAVKKLML